MAIINAADQSKFVFYFEMTGIHNFRIQLVDLDNLCVI